MVTAPMMNRAIDVSLPVANQPDKAPDNPITVSINSSGQTFIGDKAVNAVLLEDRIRALMEGRTAKVVYLRADEGLRYGRVIAIIDKLKTAGVDHVGFVYVLPQEKAAPQ
jgi:biopolymer transport protein TolR